MENIKKKTSKISSDHLQFHLRTLRRSQHLSDEINRNNPTKATAWYLRIERTLGSLIRLGDRSPSLKEECFSASTFQQFYKRLISILQHKVQDFKGTSRETLVKLYDLITKDRCNAEARAKLKYGNNDSTNASRANNAQETPSNATEFNSWTLLCKGTGRKHPNTNDIFNSRNYAVKPKGLIVSNEYNRKCRICKFLEGS